MTSRWMHLFGQRSSLTRRSHRVSARRGRRFTPAVELLEGRTVPSFLPAVHYSFGESSGAPIVGDFNNDNHPDVLLPAFSGSRLFLANRDGTLRAPLRLDPAILRVAETGDFNGDGRLDLVGSNNNSVRVWLGNGNGTFQSPLTQSVFPHSRPLSLASADFNRDSRADLVLANWEFSWSGVTPVTVLLGNGNGTFQEPLNYDSHRGRQYLAVADFNRDNFPDLVIHNSYSGDISVLLNAADWGTTPSDPPPSDPPPADPVTVQDVVINDGSPQRSTVTRITVTFSGIATFDGNAFELLREDGTPMGLEVSTSEVGGQTVAVLTFTGPDLVDGSLPDGSYILIIRGDRFLDSSGRLLDGDADGSPGGDRIEAFFRLFGDFDGDGDVDEGGQNE